MQIWRYIFNLVLRYQKGSTIAPGEIGKGFFNPIYWVQASINWFEYIAWTSKTPTTMKSRTFSFYIASSPRLASQISTQVGHMKKIYKELETLQADTAVQRSLTSRGFVSLGKYSENWYVNFLASLNIRITPQPPIRSEKSKELLQSFAQLTKLDVGLNNLVVRTRLEKSFCATLCRHHPTGCLAWPGQWKAPPLARSLQLPSRSPKQDQRALRKRRRETDDMSIVTYHFLCDLRWCGCNHTAP